MECSHLPRSLVWRLQLGLLEPPAVGQEISGLKLPEVLEHNAKSLREKHARYKELRAEYGSHLAVDTDLHQTDGTDFTSVKSDGSVEGDVHHHHHHHHDSNDYDNNKNDITPSQGNGRANVDPLTAMLMEQQAKEDRRQELDLKYRKERARRKRGLASPAQNSDNGSPSAETGPEQKPVDRSALNIIDKDLNRLPCPEDGRWRSAEYQQQWTQALREILYIYSQERPHIGYRQGMHEIASYLFLVLSLDRKQQEQQLQEEYMPLLFSESSAYFLLESILNDIRQAFDVKVASNSRPLEEMALSILNKIRYSHGDAGGGEVMCTLLETLSVPPEMYCTKWIRLLYSREVVGWKNVLSLWDVFVKLVSEGWQWMAVLETMASCRIILCGDQLLHPDNHNNTIDLLMNMPPVSDIEPLVTKLHQLLHEQQQQQQRFDLNNTPLPTPVQSNNSMFPQQSHNSISGAARASHPLRPGFPQAVIASVSANNSANTAFSLRNVRQSLEHGVGKISTGSDTLRKRLYQEWESLKQQPTQTSSTVAPMTRSYMDPLFPMACMDGEQEIPSSAAYHPSNRVASDSLPPINNAPSGDSFIPLRVGVDPLQNGDSSQSRVVNNIQQGALPAMSLSGSGAAAVVVRNQQLANSLGTSVGVLQKFAMSVAKRDRNTFATGPNANYYTDVPNSVWEALVEIEVVRGALLQKDAYGNLK